MSNDTIEISTADLTKGMTVFREARGGQWKPDFKIGEPFFTSGPDRLQPLAFNTDNGVKVFAHCAIVRIGTGTNRRLGPGRQAKNTAQGGRTIGRQQRRNRKGHKAQAR